MADDMLKKMLCMVIACMFLFGLAACNEKSTKGEAKQMPGLKDISAVSWEKLAQKKICFGHQSVGANILNGINDLMKENPRIKLRIVETADSRNFDAGVFAHFRVGHNMNPQSKIDSFARAIEEGIGEKVDIAFFKFCYVDFDAETDVDKLFDSYRETLKRLANRYPKVMFVHVTVPLIVKQTGLKALVKRILGRPVGGVEDNIVRNRFNELLRKEYLGKAPLFDLAAIESTKPDGKKSVGEKGGKCFYTLFSGYSNDDGHLNERGRREAASRLLSLLVKLSDTK